MPDALQWLPTAVAVVLFLGAATVYLRGSKDKGTIETLGRNNAALTDRVTILEADAVVAKAADEAKGQRIEALERENLVLTNTVNSSELILALKTDLGDRHGATMDSLEQIHVDLAGLPGQLALILGGKT